MSRITKAEDIKIQEYLEYPELKIPMFQRGYVWEDEEIEEFWDDLVEEQIQFLGSVILKDENYLPDSGEGYLEIVDGQQRTISLLILLAVIAKEFNLLSGSRKQGHEQNAEKHAEEINKLISKRDRKDLTKVLSYKLVLPTKEDDDMLKKVLNGEKIDKPRGSHRKFCAAQEKLEALLSDYLKKIKTSKAKIDALINIKNRILDIKVIQALVPSDEDAYMIFEAVNARGADLGAAELLKNYLFANLKNKQKDIHEEWEKVRRTLAAINRRSLDLTGFLRYYWIGKYNHLSKKGLYKGIKKKMGTKSAVGGLISPENILNEISAFRTTLELVYLSGLDDWRQSFGDSKQQLPKSLEWFSYKNNLNYFPKSIQYLPIYSALVGNLEKIDLSNPIFIRILGLVEKINFLFSYAQQGQTNKLDKLFSEIGRGLLEKIGDSNGLMRELRLSVKILEEFLAQNLDRSKIDRFVATLNWNNSSDKSIIYFILSNLEYKLGGYSRPLIKDDLSLEHVYPKSIEKKKKLDNWPELDFDYGKLGHGIGNLTFLPISDPRSNSSAGEQDFITKRDKYLTSSGHAVNRYFNSIPKWGKSEIEERLRYIQDEVWKYWGPDPSFSKFNDKEDKKS